MANKKFKLQVVRVDEELNGADHRTSLLATATVLLPERLVDGAAAVAALGRAVDRLEQGS